MKDTLEQVLQDVLDSRFRDLHTSMPGRIESYDASKQTASVQPLIKRVDFDSDGEQSVSAYPVLNNVPVQWPRFGGFFVHGPLAKGDFVLLVFCETPTDPFRARGTLTHPGDLRRHTLTGAVAIPGFYPSARALDSAGEDLVIGHEDGGQIRLSPDGSIALGESPSGPVALANKVHGAITGMLMAGIGVTGTEAFAAALSAWTSGTLGGPPPMDPPVIEPVGAEKVTAE